MILVLVLLVSHLFSGHCTSDGDLDFMEYLQKMLSEFDTTENQFAIGYVKKANAELRGFKFNGKSDEPQFDKSKTMDGLLNIQIKVFIRKHKY